MNKLPAWFRQEIPHHDSLQRMRGLLKRHGLHTVCQGAHCPNIGKCWERGVATMMILGDVCTRSCRFCAVRHGDPEAVRPDEPQRVAAAVAELNIGYVVITSVTRDDLPDGGAAHFAATVKAIRNASPRVRVELLVPDFRGEHEHLAFLTAQPPDVIGHNIETVKALFATARPQGDFSRSLELLRAFKQRLPHVLVKSGFMAGMGESRQDITDLLNDLRDTGCDMVTIGQYLAPAGTERYLTVDRFITPEEFGDIETEAREIGFKSVECGPLVRSSYLAENGYLEAIS